MDNGKIYFFTDTKLPKTEILRGHNAFNSVFENSSKANSGLIRAFFSVNSTEQNNLESPSASIQTGFVVSKKKIRKSVSRSRVKRLLREAYRLEKVNILSDSVKQNYKIIFTLSDSGFENFLKEKDLDIKILRNDMNRMLTKIFQKNI